MAFNPDGKMLATDECLEQCTIGEIRLWDVSDPAQAKPLGAPIRTDFPFANSVTFSPDGKTLAAGVVTNSDFTQSEISLWDVSDPARVATLAPLTGVANMVNAVAFSPDGKTLASGSCGNLDANNNCTAGELRLWDVRDRAQAKSLGAPTALGSGTDRIRFSPDGKTLATSCEDGTIRLWEVSDPTHPTALGAPLTGHTRWVYGLAFSPDGKTLASGDFDGNLILWDVNDPAQAKPPLDTFVIHYTDPVKSVAFSSDGKTLVFGSDDKTIHLWDTSTMAEAKPLGAPLTGHTSGVWSVALSPDGKTLASGSQV